MVVVPKLALFKVAELELPVLGRFVDAGLEALTLLVFGDMQEDFDDRRALIGEHLLEVADVLVALAPSGLGNDVTNANHQDVLVVTPVEDRDVSRRGGVLMDAPQVVVRQLF